MALNHHQINLALAWRKLPLPHVLHYQINLLKHSFLHVSPLGRNLLFKSPTTWCHLKLLTALSNPTPLSVKSCSLKPPCFLPPSSTHWKDYLFPHWMIWAALLKIIWPYVMEGHFKRSRNWAKHLQLDTIRVFRMQWGSHLYMEVPQLENWISTCRRKFGYYLTPYIKLTQSGSMDQRPKCNT